MRKFAGVLVAAALVLPVGVIASQADAVSGTSCKTTSGTATFKPALPKLGSSAKVVSSVAVTNGKVGSCVGGGVQSGAVKLTSKFSKPGNCSTLATAGSTNPTKGTETITWNTKQTSTVTLSLTGVKGHPTQAKIAGTVTAGLFKGSKETGTVGYVIPKGACTAKPLSVVTFKQVTALIIK